jgi:hypothetical protein
MSKVVCAPVRKLDKRLETIIQREKLHGRQRSALAKKQRKEVRAVYDRCLPVGTQLRLLQDDYLGRAGMLFVIVEGASFFNPYQGSGILHVRRTTRKGTPTGKKLILDVHDLFYTERWQLL